MHSVHYQDYLQAKEANPGKYARDLAEILGISEAELTALRVSHDAAKLNVDGRTLLAALESVGGTKSITRNDYAVHEQEGHYTNQHLNGHAGLILNPRALDLRLFLQHWVHIFSMTESTPRGERYSIQFFDAQGDAVHKVYTTDETDMAMWNALVDQYKTDVNPPLQMEAAPATPVLKAADPTALEAEWRAMTDVHQFFQLLKRHNVTRQQAFKAVGDDLAWRVENGSLTRLLNIAKADQNEIMIFVGNQGCVQIFTGQIEKVMPHGEWINVFNQRFTLHLVESAIAESWITRKPTKDGFVTSLELFAADGTQIAQLYGQRTEGTPEQTLWREQLAQLCSEGVAA
ncbi:hemin-degrading factor [Enterobacteriaceae bacterium Kacie_13]|nr:hemin-degrading factor [Enterobacteriaceae bacterium Kacie_13]